MLPGITCGHPLASVAGPGFLISDVHYGAGDTYERHAHELGYLLLVCSGGFAEEARSGSVEVTSGDVLVVPAGHAHRDVIARHGARGLLVTVEPSFGVVPRQWRAHRGGPVSRALIALHRELANAREPLKSGAVAAWATEAGGRSGRRSTGSREVLSMEEQIVAALSEDAPAEAMDHRAVRTARELLDAHFAHPLRLGDIAREAGVTPSYLARAFRRVEGRTMGAHLRATRARRAAALLASTQDPLADVAAATGFADQSHLSRVFAATYGVTPRRYRQLMRRSNAFKT